jgi:hypothetical protein
VIVPDRQDTVDDLARAQTPPGSGGQALTLVHKNVIVACTFTRDPERAEAIRAAVTAL